VTALDPAEGLLGWLAEQRETQQCVVTPIALRDSREWQLVDGAIRHRTGRYFSVVGVEDDATGWQAPLLEQREIGTLAFIRRERAGQVEILVQAKLEPGDLGLSQLAPSVQATASNLERVHGGAAQPFADLVSPQSQRDADSLQSEQGTRFLGKLNRNVLVTADIPSGELPTNLRWAPAQEVLAATHIHHAINTDARSVLVTAPWELLTAQAPFSRGRDAWSAALETSYQLVRTGQPELAREQITKLRAGVEPQVLDLDQLSGWSLDLDGSVTLKGGEFVVRQIGVETNAREVAHWDQPIIDSGDQVRADLLVSVLNGVAYFDLSPSVEAGLVHRAEWGPTRIHSTTTPAPATDGRVLAQISQSDEGGRFFQDVTQYRLVRVDLPEPGPGQIRLTLGELKPLLAQGGWLTNEARSVLSLLLRWL